MEQVATRVAALSMPIFALIDCVFLLLSGIYRGTHTLLSKITPLETKYTLANAGFLLAMGIGLPVLGTMGAVCYLIYPKSI